MTNRAVAVAKNEAHRRAGLAWTIFFLVAGVVAAMTTVASGQQAKYDVMSMHKAFEEKSTVDAVERAARMYATMSDLSEFTRSQYAQAYFRVYVPQKITQPDAVAEISKHVSNAMDLLGRSQRIGAPASREILAALYRGLRPVAEGNYHPAARINAILALGRLNVAPAANNQPPRPVAQLFPFLLQIYQDESNVDGVRAAALQGIHRHVMYGFPAIEQTDRNAVTVAMQKLLDEPAPPGRNARAHAYLQRYAVDVLDILRQPDDKSLATKLISISTEPSRPDLIALYSAARVGQMPEQLQGTLDAPEAVLQSWSARVLDAFETEIARLKGLTRAKPARTQPPSPDGQVRKTTEAKAPTTMPGGGPGGYGGGGYGQGSYDASYMEQQMMGGMGSGMGEYGSGAYGMGDYGMGGPGMMSAVPPAKPQPPEILISRRHLNTVLQQVLSGVYGSGEATVPDEPGGILAAVSEAQRPAVQQWITQISEVITALNDKTLDDQQKYLLGLDEQLEPLRQLAGVEVEAEPEVPTQNIGAMFSGFNFEKDPEASADAAPVAPPQPSGSAPPVAIPQPPGDAAPAVSPQPSDDAAPPIALPLPNGP